MVFLNLLLRKNNKVFGSFCTSITLTFLTVSLCSPRSNSLISSVGSRVEMRFIPQTAGLSNLNEILTYHSTDVLPCGLEKILSLLSVVPRDHWIKLDAEDKQFLEVLGNLDFKVVTNHVHCPEAVRVRTLRPFWQNLKCLDGGLLDLHC